MRKFAKSLVLSLAAIAAALQLGACGSVSGADLEGDTGPTVCVQADTCGPCPAGTTGTMNCDVTPPRCICRSADGGSVDTGAPDAGPADTGHPDTGMPDAGPGDTGPSADTGVCPPVDSGPADSGPADSGPGPRIIGRIHWRLAVTIPGCAAGSEVNAVCFDTAYTHGERIGSPVTRDRTFPVRDDTSGAYRCIPECNGRPVIFGSDVVAARTTVDQLGTELLEVLDMDVPSSVRDQTHSAIICPGPGGNLVQIAIDPRFVGTCAVFR